jgi:hypothetical protein
VNTQQAAHAVAHDFAHNTDTLASLMGLSSGAILRNKVVLNRTADNRNHLTLAEAVRMTEITGDERILKAWASERNAVIVHLPEASVEPDNEELLVKFMSLTSHYGDLAKRHQEATEDGEVDDDEMADLRRIGNLIHQTVEEINALTERIYTRTSAPKNGPKVVRARTA